MKLNIICQVLLINLVKGYVISDNDTTDANNITDSDKDEINNDVNSIEDVKPEKVFDGVYSECLVYMSYVCLQNKTMVYINELNKLNEVGVLGDYVKLVKVNNSIIDEEITEISSPKSSEELSLLIDKAVDRFFYNHVLKFNFLGRDVTIPQTAKEFAGRKRKGGGGGGGHMHDDGGKKKMMMMAMMCMKMKLMMMMPAMMGMMGMMSFKGMMFSMMSFMISKMMLLMKILEKKGGGGGGGGGGGDGGWAAAGGGGAWMPAGQDGGGGYDANAQWQSRSIFENTERADTLINEDKPTITYVTPVARYNFNVGNKRKPISMVKKLNNEVIRAKQEAKMREEIEIKDSKAAKSRKKRGIVDVLQNAYIYWLNKILGNNFRYYPKYPRYKVMHGVKYVYYPITVQKVKTPKELTFTEAPAVNNYKQINFEDFNKGEIVETPETKEEGRSMTKKKMKALSNAVNEAIETNPWE